jgi:peptidoglycan DL-endopeptidase CwlO
VLGAPSRLAALTAASFIVLVCVSSPAAKTSPTQSLEQQKRSALLDLYSLDSQVAAANAKLASLSHQASSLRHARRVLVRELRLARVDSRVAERRLAQRLRALYDHGGTSSIDLVFGAHSLSEIFAQLDDLRHVSSADGDILVQVRQARTHEVQARRELAARQASVAEAIRAEAAESRRLVAARADRAAFVARLEAREAYDARRVARVEASAQVAQQKSVRLTAAVPRPAAGWVSVVSTGYCLHGRTATGIPVGWGVVAVDPAVIPLGTHLTIPGYGDAIAADTGGAVVGGRIDLWFPSCAQAGGWGSRSVTIVVH